MYRRFWYVSSLASHAYLGLYSYSAMIAGPCDPGRAQSAILSVTNYKAKSRVRSASDTNEPLVRIRGFYQWKTLVDRPLYIYMAMGLSLFIHAVHYPTRDLLRRLGLLM